jgi:hypothetical protein
MARYFLTVFFLLTFSTAASGSGSTVIYQADGASYEGYYVSPGKGGAPRAASA